MKKPRLHITDRAVVRYLERVQGMDIPAIRAEIGRRVDIAEPHHTCNGVQSDGFTYRIDGDHVIDVLKTVRPVAGIGNRKRNRRG